MLWYSCVRLLALYLLTLTFSPNFSYQISLTKKFSKLQYNFNRTIHLLNKRQPVKPLAIKPVSHEVLGRLPANVDATSNTNFLARGNDANPGISQQMAGFRSDFHYPYLSLTYCACISLTGLTLTHTTGSCSLLGSVGCNIQILLCSN